MEMVRPNMTIYWGNRDGNNPLIGLITIQRAEGSLHLEVAFKCALVAIVIKIIRLDNFRVEIRIIGHTMNWIIDRLGNVCHVADIYL